MLFVSVLGMMIFLVAAAIQYNDPDPYIWIPIYILPAFICLFSIPRAMHWTVPLIISGINYIGFILMAKRVFSEQPLFSEMAREMWGLLIIAVWMNILGVLLILNSKKTT
jgi:hypothetical protein